ncbi:MAG TPA: IPT/TIG domain-containing protein [Solirubrobacteraceae bacterium]|nr:IPT/TIG domain-containing protein [Solirubrobacteraceae bacterium]
MSRRKTQRRHRRPTRLAAALLGAGALLLGAAPVAAASPSASVFRPQRVCEVRRPRTAGCMGIRLLARSLTSAELHTDAVTQAREAARGVSPAVTNKAPLAGGLTPQNLHAAYSLPTETLAAGTQTIALVDAFNDPSAEADLGVFDAQFGLPACTTADGCFRKLDEQGKTSPLPRTSGEWATEMSLDLQMAHAICQNCHLLLVEADSESIEDLGAAVDAAVKAGATEVSNSYEGIEEPGDGASIAPWEHAGVVITASSGDCGYLDRNCWEPGAPNFPSDSPDVIAVGGTALTDTDGSWSSSVWEGGGSGCSEVFAAPLWQTSVADFAQTGCGVRRSSTDVAADADPWTGVDVYDSTPSEDGYPTGWGIWGGTSESSPIVAAEFALAGGAHGVAYPAATLYSNLGDERALSDVVSGENGSCETGIECKAAVGYDGPTGVGSPIGLDAFFPGGAPASTSAPSISGTAEETRTLSVAGGGWTGEPSATALQWELCNASGTGCTAISGATKQTYTVPASDLGLTLRVQESASDEAGAGAPAISAATVPVASDSPTITGFTPASGVTGSTVTITGTHLETATKVKFGSLSATFKVLSATALEATVPDGAAPAKISVATPVKTATSTATFTPALSLTSFAPKSAFAGKVVTVTGVGFNGSSSVSFAGVPAHTVEVSATTLQATVPATAANGPVSVTNDATPLGTVSSASAFALVAPAHDASRSGS